jgi:4-hydroxy-tetrahydrodipicolinate synthase
MTDLAGVFPTIPTPFKHDEEIDEGVLRAMIDRLIDAGVDGILPVGSMGEGPMLTEEERRRVLDVCFDHVRRRVKIIVGASAHTTRGAIKFCKEAGQLGAVGVMIAPPWYGFPSDRELERHYRDIGQSSPVPVIVYNNPYKTGGNIAPAILAKLAETEPQVRHCKETSPDVTRIAQIFAETDKMSVFCGTDNLLLETYFAGGTGLMTAIAVVAPKQCIQLHKMAMEKRWEEARAISDQLLPLGTFFETGRFTAFAKAAMVEAGYPVGNPRLPMLPPDDDELSRLREAMKPLLGLGVH